MKYLTLNELRTKLGGRARSTIYNDIKLGRLPTPIRIGTRIYWPESQLDKFLLEGRK